MELSVIIVSYNVRYFLEKCLVSVQKALKDLQGEIIVVDNASSDTSVEMVRAKFPDVALIANPDNRGFAKACNQGLQMSSGRYVLLLNPDTLVSEPTFSACITFMDAHPEASSCGVRMMDGTGATLPESMRGLPTPLSAFFKMTGLSSLFPNSPFFNGYYMGGVDRGSVQPSPVLTGAFMFIRRSVLDEVGLLDEDYFMYGEDIDLSYRMLKAGYRNYYLPEPAIIHYKGESTHREQLKYVRHFYNAMLIYLRKHFQGTGGSIFRFMVVLGVVVRGGLSALRRFIVAVIPVVLDGIILVSVLLSVKQYWASHYFGDAMHFQKTFSLINTPLYAGLCLLFLFLSGAHDPQRNARRVLSGMLLGTAAILIVYAMLPLGLRSSRAVILISAVLSLVLLIAGTLIWRGWKDRRSARRTIVVGDTAEVARILEIMNRVGKKSDVVGWVAVDERSEGHELLGHISLLSDVVKDYGITEIVFSQDLPFTEMQKWMSKIGPSVAYRISSSDSEQIVGSDSKKEQGQFYQATVEFALAYPMHKRQKRILDVVVSVLLLILYVPARLTGLMNHIALQRARMVLTGKRSWVGYFPGDTEVRALPTLREGILTPVRSTMPLQAGEIHVINYIYAREYRVWRDVDLVLRGLPQILKGRN